MAVLGIKSSDGWIMAQKILLMGPIYGLTALHTSYVRRIPHLVGIMLRQMVTPISGTSLYDRDTRT